MPRTRREPPSTNTTNATPSGTSRPRRRGGQELPDDVQDRPEQNAGYDEAVRSGPAGTPEDPLMELDADLHTEDPNVDDARQNEGGDDRLEAIDERASRRAAGEVRHRERGGR